MIFFLIFLDWEKVFDKIDYKQIFLYISIIFAARNSYIIVNNIKSMYQNLSFKMMI